MLQTQAVLKQDQRGQEGINEPMSKSNEPSKYDQPLADDEIVIHVAPGSAKLVKLVETPGEPENSLRVRVSRTRSVRGVPVLGVVVK